MKIINMTVQEHPILIDKYLMGRELEVDGVFDGEDILIPGIMEHVERAGVHSGDSIAVYPPINLEDKHRELILKHTKNMAKHLGVIGLINAQYILYNDDIYVIEVNPRSSRTIPYISKVTGVPIIDLATKVMLGQKLKDLGYGTGLYPEAKYYAVKAPVVSCEKLTDVDTGLGPEMKSTGEVLGLAETYPCLLYTSSMNGMITCAEHFNVAEIMEKLKAYRVEGTVERVSRKEPEDLSLIHISSSMREMVPCLSSPAA